MTQVGIVQRVLPHYRVPFFEQLRLRLEEEGIELRVIVGQPNNTESTKNDSGTLSWAENICNRYIPVGSHELVWQPCLHSLRSCDLVIVEHATKLLLDHLLLAWRPFGGPKVAFWGHGRNFDQDAASSVAEWTKRRAATRADWWFCYTERSARIVESLGVPEGRRTVVQNAVDTARISELRNSLTDEDLAELRHDLGIGPGPIAVALGSIYPTKRPEYLVEAADTIRADLPDFELLVIGNGPDRHVIDRAAATRSWIHPVGALTGFDMVRHAALGSVILNPGVVGLAVLDAFALGLPVVTCDLLSHGPEFEYLVHDRNGLILPTDSTPIDFGRRVIQLLCNPVALVRLTNDAVAAASAYSLEEMVTRFVLGIRDALSSE